MKLTIKDILDREICHFAEEDLSITSKHNRVFVKSNTKNVSIVLPGDGIYGFFAMFRLLRRALRLDKCNVVPIGDDLVMVRQGKVYRYDAATHGLTETLQLRSSRVALHQSIAVVDGRVLYFGEYGRNPDRNEVPVYRSVDGGKSWHIIYLFPKDKIKHVHGCYHDPIEDRIWVLTGDFKGECHMLVATCDFTKLEWIGNGQQAYRACNVFFEQDSVHWIMDSPLEDSYHVRLHRRTRTIEKRQVLPGPVWYIKHLDDGYYLAATAQEIGPGVRDRSAHLMVSRDLDRWETLHTFEHDGFPKRYFKFGVIGFADGRQGSDGFYLFCEALKGFDGKTMLCAIE